MITPRPSAERGHFNHGWLDSYHSFSFAEYFDPAHMGFRALRVINEDRIEAGAGFPTHGHQNMEIITYMLAGELEHKDSLGSGSVIRPGVIQRMTAGTGIRHSEFNPSADNPCHLLQIWMLPERDGLAADYEEKEFPLEGRTNRLQVIAAPNGAGGGLHINQDIHLYATVIGAGGRVSHPLSPGRHAWVQVASGAVEINGLSLVAGDGAAISDEVELTLTSRDGAECLLFDLA